MGFLTCTHTPSDASQARVFVPGEKVWVTQMEVRHDGVFFSLLTDPYGDVRYRALLKFPFPKGSTPAPDQIEKTVAEVFAIQPSDNASGNAQQTAPPPQPAGVANDQAGTGGARPSPGAPQPAEAPPPPIAPPPPPPADPKTIAIHQTMDQVVANFGQPEKKIKLASKEIWVYKDMKVTFVAGKVADVQ